MAEIGRARSGGGPTLLECKTYRFFDHVGVRGMGLSYRSDEEVERWKKRDPILLMEERLQEQNVLTADQIKAVHETTAQEVQAGIKFAEDSPFPEPSALTEDGAQVQINFPLFPRS